MKAFIEILLPGQAAKQTPPITSESGQELSMGQADCFLGFGNAARLFCELTPSRLAVLEQLKQSGPTPVYSLAKALGRSYGNVHNDVARLLKHKLVAKDWAGKVYVPWDELEFHMNMGRSAA